MENNELNNQINETESKVDEVIVASISKTTNTTTKISPRFAYIGGLLSGIASIVLGILTYTLNFAGYTSPFHQYNGEAYTGIQQAAAQTAENVYYLSKTVIFGLGSVLIILGLAIIFFFTSKLLAQRNK